MVFQRNDLPSSSTLHGVTSQKIITAVRASNRTLHNLLNLLMQTVELVLLTNEM
jgi:hypothetical protein